MLKFISILVICLFCSISHAQTGVRGTEIKGTELGDPLASLKQLGLIAAFQAGSSVVMNGTNVQAWIDLTGNNFNMVQYVAANQPTFLPSVTTNMFPAVIFSGSPRIMHSNRIGQRLNASTNMTIIQLICAQSLGLSDYSAAAGYTGATNTAFSQIAIIPNNTTVNSRIRFGGDSGNVTLSSSLSINTNIYKYMGTTVLGPTGTISHNLTMNMSTVIPTNRTLDTFAIGGMIGSNSVASAHSSVYVTGTWVFTNALTGTQMTNIINHLNTRRKVF